MLFSACIIREAENVQEVATAIAWAVEEGWPVGKEDDSVYFEIFGAGCKLLYHDNELMGALLLSDYDMLTFIGLFIIKKQYRNQGLGQTLWQNGLLTAGKRQVALGLFAVPSQMNRYVQSGFIPYYSVERWEVDSSMDPIEKNSAAVEVLRDNRELFSKIEEYDKQIFPANRFNLIKALLEKEGTITFGLISEKQITGYGFVRPCQLINTYRMALYADNCNTAQVLAEALLVTLSGGTRKKIFFDIPSTNENLKRFSQYFRLRNLESSHTYMMFKNMSDERAKCINPPNKIYGVCSLESG